MAFKGEPMKSKKDEIKDKVPYEKPMLRIIQMETDQVLGIGCKMVGMADFGDPSACFGSFCSEDGS